MQSGVFVTDASGGVGAVAEARAAGAGALPAAPPKLDAERAWLTAESAGASGCGAGTWAAPKRTSAFSHALSSSHQNSTEEIGGEVSATTSLSFGPYDLHNDTASRITAVSPFLSSRYSLADSGAERSMSRCPGRSRGHRTSQLEYKCFLSWRSRSALLTFVVACRKVLCLSGSFP